MRKITAHASEISARGLQLAGRDQDFAVRKVHKAAVMVHMQMGQDDPFHIARTDAERAQLRTDLLFALDAERDFPSDIRVKRLAGFEQVRALPGVDHDDAFGMIDDPCVGRQPFGPVCVSKNREPPPQTVSLPLDLRGLDPDEPGLDGMYFHDRKETSNCADFAMPSVWAGLPKVASSFRLEVGRLD